MQASPRAGPEADAVRLEARATSRLAVRRENRLKSKAVEQAHAFHPLSAEAPDEAYSTTRALEASDTRRMTL